MTDLESKKRVLIDESGILTIENDNALWVNGDVTTKIEGEYRISAEDLRRLMVMMTGQDTMQVRTVVTSWMREYYPCPTIYNTWITSNVAVAEEVEKMHKAYDRVKSDLEDAKIKCQNIKRKHNEFVEQIKKFNDSRHWWERKIDISSEEIE